MRQIIQVALGAMPVPVIYNDPDVRPVMIRMVEDDAYPTIFVEHDPTPLASAPIALSFHYTFSTYPSNDWLWFGACLSMDRTALIHGIFKVDWATKPSRMTQPNLPGPPGPQGPMGMQGIPGPPSSNPGLPGTY